jgi:hypothetical protein
LEILVGWPVHLKRSDAEKRSGFGSPPLGFKASSGNISIFVQRTENDFTQHQQILSKEEILNAQHFHIKKQNIRGVGPIRNLSPVHERIL